MHPVSQCCSVTVFVSAGLAALDFISHQSSKTTTDHVSFGVAPGLLSLFKSWDFFLSLRSFCCLLYASCRVFPSSCFMTLVLSWLVLFVFHVPKKACTSICLHQYLTQLLVRTKHKGHLMRKA